MFQILLVVFLVIPVIEIYLLIQVGSMIGAGWTIFFVIATAILGVSLLRQQGLSTWTRLNQSMAQGQLPPTILVEGLLLLLSGAFLLTPGFFTDTIGFLFLMPVVRKVIAIYLMRKGLFMATNMQHNTRRSYSASTRHQAGESKVIEGEYERKDE